MEYQSFENRVTGNDLAQVRRMVNEPTQDPYTDAILTEIIARYPLADACGKDPVYKDTSTTPPTLVSKDNWIPTWDLYRAASDICFEKEANAADCTDFAADGISVTKDQISQHWRKLANRYASRGAIRVIVPVSHEATV